MVALLWQHKRISVIRINVTRLLLALPLLLLPYQAQATTQLSKIDETLPRLLKLDFVAIPARPDYDKEVLVPLHEAQAKQAAEEAAAKAAQEAAEAAAAAEAARQAEIAAEAARQAEIAAQARYAASGGLIGTEGYSNAWGNCVNEPGVNNPGWGNPIDWPITSTRPWIGASALFYFNHVAVVTGMWSNGDVEVRQQNSPGMIHRIPASMIRGYR